MKLSRREWQKRLARNVARDSTMRRNRPIVHKLTIVTVVLLLASLAAEFWIDSRVLMVACYVGSAIVGAALLAFLFNKRLWVELPPPR